MRKSRFNEEEIIGFLKEHQVGIGAKELCRKHGISDGTFYKWRSKYGGMEVSEAIRLKALEVRCADEADLVVHTTNDRFFHTAYIVKTAWADPASCGTAL